MACYHPRRCYTSKTLNPESGLRRLVLHARDAEPASWLQPGRFPCGQCLGCRLDWAGDWAARCEKEAKLHEANCFITLTYDDKCLPVGGTSRSTVSKRDFQLFMKRLRKAYPTNEIRYFACGEYGNLNQRAHYHALLFNHDFADKRLWKPHPRHPLYLSKSLQSLWGLGFTSIGTVTFSSASYVARYVVKKLTGTRTDYLDREKPFILMSRRPGIGSAFYEKYKDEIYPAGQLLVGENKPRRTPRYFDEKYRRENPDGHYKMKLERKLVATTSTDNTIERLLTREKILKANFNSIPRNL